MFHVQETHKMDDVPKHVIVNHNKDIINQNDYNFL